MIPAGGAKIEGGAWPRYSDEIFAPPAGIWLIMGREDLAG